MIVDRPDVRRRLVDVCGDEGRAWLDSVPELIQRLAVAWELDLDDRGWGNYSFAISATRRGQPVVLKLCPRQMLEPEAAALQAWHGQAAVRLLECDPEAGAMLIERAVPGDELTQLAKDGSDEEATAIACEVMRRLSCATAAVNPIIGETAMPRPRDAASGRGTAVPAVNESLVSGGFLGGTAMLRPVWATPADRAADLARLRERYDGGTGPFPARIVDRAEAAFAELIPSQGQPVLIHGDLHHENILSAEREPWLVIDPHGMVAEAEYETYALLKNPTGVARWPDVEQVTRRRIDQMADLLGFDRRRIVGWGIAGAVLSAWWTLEGHGFDYEDDLAIAEIIAEQSSSDLP